MELKYDSKLPTKLHLYALSAILFVVVGFAALIGPFVAAYFTDEKYNIERIRHTDEELEAKHEAIWENLSSSWKQFWLNKISSHLIGFYAFPERLETELEAQGDARLSWDNAEYLEFYTQFLKNYPDLQGLDLGGKVYYYLLGPAGEVLQVADQKQAGWKNLADLKPLDVQLYLGYDAAKILKDRSVSSYLQYDLQLGINHHTLESVLTLLLYDFAMEGHKLRFAVSIEMGNVFDRASGFFTYFANQLNHMGGNRNQLQTSLLTLDEAEDNSYFFKTYGNQTSLKKYDLSSGKLSNQRDAFYSEMAAAILAVIRPSSDPNLSDPSLDFLLSAESEEERGRRLDMDLQMRGYMKPLVVSNVFESLDQRYRNDYKPQVISIGKMYMLPTSRNLVILDSVVNQIWWDNSQFLNGNYRRKLINIVLLFAIFFIIMFIPLLFYSFFMTQYARDFLHISQYVKRLPTPDELVERHDNCDDGKEGQEGHSHAELLAKIQALDAESAMGERLVLEVQQRFVKLVETVNYWREQSVTDELTGLLNRKGLDQICSYEFNRMKRSGSSFSLILLDVDRFKDINDKYGHEIGDLALKSLTNSLVSTFRMSDHLGRWGGEEFLIILPDTSLQGAIQVAEGARRTVEQMIIQTREASLQLTICIGLASSSRDLSFTDTLNYADKSLYQAKENGRNQVWAFSEEDGFFAVPSKRGNERKLYG